MTELSNPMMEILEVVKEIHANLEAFMSTTNDFASEVDRRFSLIDARFDAIDRRLDAMDKRFDAIDRRLDAMDKRLDRIEATMVTKDYLDEELVALRGDLVVVMRKEDRKMEASIDTKLLKLQKAV